MQFRANIYVFFAIALSFLEDGTPSDTITLFKFPNDPVLREKWVKQVRRTHAEWTATEHSVLCNEHFMEDCFEADAALAQSFGISKKRRLNFR